MAYTVKKLAEMSGVSVRTLHFYDEIGLLKPAYHGLNGYRFYEEDQLLMLQQILFFRELGFELKQIQKILGKKDFDKIVALSSHKQVLEKNVKRTKGLIKTIDKTIDHLKGIKKMKDQEMYSGFSAKEQAEYQTYLKHRFGENHPSFAECENNLKQWTGKDWESSNKEADGLFKELVKRLEEGCKVDSTDVQGIIRKHYAWIKKFWTPDRASYTGLGQVYMGFEWKKFFGKYDSEHPRLAKYLAEAMKVFADKELE
jgi:DNA-binding transcriptional MerR regulator